MRIQNLFSLGVVLAAGTIVGCSSNNTTSTLPGGGNNSAPTGGKASVGGATGVGGGAVGGSTSASTGGSSSVGQTGGTSSSVPGTGGTSSVGATGGKSTVGATGGKTGTAPASGGTSTGLPTGGTTNIGGPTGGTVGTPTGGTSTNGGAPATGGSATNGGAPATGGSATAGGASGARPKGYYYTKDWSVTSVDWHGCVWTGIDTVASTKTTITPQDFMAGTDGGPYEVSGSVNGAYESVALLGFNINEAINGKADQCKYSAATATAAGPPSLSMTSITSSTKGLAVNWTAKTKPGQFRVQLQAPDSATNLKHSWCATITDATGPSFIKWTDFYAYCWDYPTPVDSYAAIQYKNEDIDAISFLVPGVTTATPFDFTVVGFAPGNSSTDAPGKVTGCGQQSGTLGAGGPSKDASMQRGAVTDATCKKYIVFNNNWGQPTSTNQTIDYSGNSFTVKTSQAATSGQGVPGSFPSVYVGASGDSGGGTFNTWSDTGLPKQISAMQSAQTTFTWTTSHASGNFNAAYDVWFAKSSPTANAYNDAISGFLMVWLYKPGSNQPIGKKVRTATIAGKSWDVWVGVRGNTSTGTDDANRPVVSYISTSAINTLTFDLKAFMSDAVTNGSADMSAGGTSQAFANSWYLTDVFAGFEAWSGSDIVGNTGKMDIAIK